MPPSTTTCPGRCPTAPPRWHVGTTPRPSSPVRRRRWPRARRGPTRPTTWWCWPGSRSGTTSSAGWSRRPSRDRSPVIDVPLPSSLSATALARLRDDPDGFAADLARPMPRQPSPAARFGTRFHAWVESRFGQQDLFDPDDLPGRGDAGIDDDADLQRADRHLRVRAVRRPDPRTPSRRRSRWCCAGRWCAAGSTRCTPSRVRTATGGWSWTGRPTGPRTSDPCSSPSTGSRGPSSWASPRAGARAVLLRAHRHRSSSPPTCPAGPSSRGVRARGEAQSAPRAAASAISTISPKVCSRSAAVVSSPVSTWSETVQIASARRPCLAASVYSALASISTASTP